MRGKLGKLNIGIGVKRTQLCYSAFFLYLYVANTMNPIVLRDADKIAKNNSQFFTK